MGIDFGTALAAAAISAAVNFAGWMVFKRAIERQDEEIAEQRAELKRLREKEIFDLRDRIEKHETDALAARRGIHQRINESVAKVECDKIEATMSENLGEIRRDMSIVRESVASHGAILKLIADRMGVTFGGPR